MKLEDFRSPGKEFRGVPFWSWNDRLEDKELVRQIAEMDEKGWGGFFMHSREGLVTPYMTEEWMDRIETCVKEAEKRGMGAWLYDEDKWPSGFAGGIVPAKSADYRGKALLMWMSGRLDEVEDAIRIFKCDLEDGRPENLKPVLRGEKEEQGKTYVYFNLFTSAIGEEWYGGYNYIDNLNPKAVETFVRSTYDAYYERVGKWFGSAIPGIFTDEPHIAPGVPGQRRAQHPVYALPWTKDFPQYFEKRKGYDVRDHLPSLFLDVGDYMKVRYDYWEAVTDLFLEAYTKKLFDWCEKHGLRYTGHYLAEDTLTSQIRCAGAAMPHYEFMHVPGIDHLGRNIDHPLTVKQVSSVAEQLGKERVLSETYGCSAQSFSFDGRKWIGDWEYILGVNLLNHHLSLYTMRGLRKRDYPPNIFYQQPWWKYNRLIEDYFARLSYALSRGKRTMDTLVLHPIASAWAVYTPLNLKPAERLNGSLEWLVKTLLNLHRDYELGDEKVMKGHGKVEGSSLIIGKSRYIAVILPPTITLSRNTFNLLWKYVNGGGKLIALKPTPHLIDGQKSREIQKVLSKAHIIDDRDEEALAKALEPIPPRVEISGANGEKAQEVWYHLRQDGDQQILFLANTSTEKGFQTTVKLRGAGEVEEWNSFTGKVSQVPSRSEDGYVVFNLDFPPVGSHLIVLDPKRKAVTPKAAKAEKIREIPLGDEWSYKRLDFNALTLDHGRVKLEDGEYGEPLPIWKVQRTLVRAGVGLNFSVQYEFGSKIETTEGRQIYLVLESPEKYAIKVNAQEIKYEDIGYWVDTTFKKISVGKLVKRGRNTIETAGKTDFETEIESCYIAGDFRVENLGDMSFALIEEPESLKSGNLVYQGYPFFAGAISLIQKVEIPKAKGRAVLEIDGLNTVVATVLVNGKEAGHIFIKPHKVEITDFLKEGKNTIEIQLTNSLRNLLGPHHHKAGEPVFVGPETFSDELNWTETFHLVPYGLNKARIKLLS